MDQHQRIAEDDRAGVALAALHFPDHGRPLGRQGSEQAGLAGVEILLRAEEMRPVAGAGGRDGQEDREEGG